MYTRRKLNEDEERLEGEWSPSQSMAGFQVSQNNASSNFKVDCIKPDISTTTTAPHHK